MDELQPAEVQRLRDLEADWENAHAILDLLGIVQELRGQALSLTYRLAIVKRGIVRIKLQDEERKETLREVIGLVQGLQAPITKERLYGALQGVRKRAETGLAYRVKGRNNAATAGQHDTGISDGPDRRSAAR